MNNPLGLKFLTHLRFGFRQLKKHKFKHNIQDSEDLLCSNIESVAHFFLHCANFTTHRKTFLNKLKSINANSFAENKNLAVRTLLLGNQTLLIQLTKKIINAVIGFILTNERFNCPVF